MRTARASTVRRWQGRCSVRVQRQRRRPGPEGGHGWRRPATACWRGRWGWCSAAGLRRIGSSRWRRPRRQPRQPTQLQGQPARRRTALVCRRVRPGSGSAFRWAQRQSWTGWCRGVVGWPRRQSQARAGWRLLPKSSGACVARGRRGGAQTLREGRLTLSSNTPRRQAAARALAGVLLDTTPRSGGDVGKASAEAAGTQQAQRSEAAQRGRGRLAVGAGRGRGRELLAAAI